MDSYILCNSQSLLDDAMKALEHAPQVILDCEGKDLGRENGSLSLISIRTTAPSPQTFLIDVIRLDNTILRPLFDLLESSNQQKIVFDGRMDFNELYHSRRIILQGVLDLQLADITSRSVRGEDEDEQLQRLSPYLHHREVRSQRNSYTSIQRLLGLDGCLREHAVEAPKKMSVSHDEWLKRPLSDSLLHYAARDVYLINLLYDNFMEAGSIDHNRLLEQSQRYITMWKDERPKPWDTIKNHGLLPLGIMDPVSSWTFVKECKSCKRNLPQTCYSKTGWRLTSKRQCWVCRALSVRDHLKKQWAQDQDSDDYGYDGDDYGHDSDIYSCGGDDYF